MRCRIGAAARVLPLLLALALGGCKDQVPRNHTAVLGSGGTEAPGALTDANGRILPQPPIAAGTTPRMARLGQDGALAVWVLDGHVVASSYTPTGGWTQPQPLEQIYGIASAPQLASNAQGKAMAVWRHTVGSIESLRFSVYQPGTGWAPPDVVPGALPRPAAAATGADRNGPRLQMDAQGNVLAEWPSGFEARELQVASYREGVGWTRAHGVPDPSAPPAPAAAASSGATSATAAAPTASVAGH